MLTNTLTEYFFSENVFLTMYNLLVFTWCCHRYVVLNPSFSCSVYNTSPLCQPAQPFIISLPLNRRVVPEALCEWAPCVSWLTPQNKMDANPTLSPPASWSCSGSQTGPTFSQTRIRCCSSMRRRAQLSLEVVCFWAEGSVLQLVLPRFTKQQQYPSIQVASKCFQGNLTN